MRILLIGSGDTIFITNYVKALKKKMDVEVHVYSPYPRIGNYDSYPYDYVYFEEDLKYKCKLLNKITFLFLPFIIRHRLSNFLKKQNKVYDVIHIHRILPSWVLKIDEYKKYSKNLFLTFWGGELEVEHIFLSRKLYLRKLKKTLLKCDKVINSFSDKRLFLQFPFLKNKGVYGIYGSSIVDEIYNIGCSRNKAKEKMGISPNSITLLIGYSGKRIHNHCEIIRRIISNSAYDIYKDKLHFIISMTRADNNYYASEIESELKKGTSSYTILRGKYSTDADIALLRIATDFMFQLSDFDGVSSSIKECLCAGSIVITGNWLHYDILKNKGFIYPEAKNIEDGVDCFYNLMRDYPHCLNNFLNNKNLGRGEYSWDSCIDNWIEEYKKVL